MKDDLISRSALLDRAYSVSRCTVDNPYGGELVVSVDDIESEPTIEVERVKHGRWTHVDYCKIGRLTTLPNGVWVSGTSISEDRWQCSVCKKYENVFKKYDFCPNCGARMDLEDSNETLESD